MKFFLPTSTGKFNQLGVLVAALAWPGAASAQTLIDDFSGYTAGASVAIAQSSSDPSNWKGDGTGFEEFRAIVDPTDSENQVLRTNVGGGKHIWSQAGSIGEDDTLTLSMRIYHGGGTANILWGMLNFNTPPAQNTSPGAMGPLMGTTGSDRNLYVRQGNGTGGGADFNVATLALETWYTITMTIDNPANTWTGTIQGGAFDDPTTLSYLDGPDTISTFGFRTDYDAALNTFLIRAAPPSSPGQQ